jgi:hypothetical protein
MPGCDGGDGGHGGNDCRSGHGSDSSIGNDDNDDGGDGCIVSDFGGDVDNDDGDANRESRQISALAKIWILLVRLVLVVWFTIRAVAMFVEVQVRTEWYH